MHKKILSMILAIAMVISLFAGIAVTASAATGAFVKCTDETLTSGKYVLVAGSSALTNTAASNWGALTAVEPADDQIVDPDDSIVWTLNVTDGAFTLYNEAAAVSVYCSAAKKLAMDASNATTWTATAQGDGTYKIYNETAGYLSLNGSSGFRPYANGYGTFVFTLYKLSEGACTHANATSETTTAATCTEAGVETWTCPDCEATWTEAVEATDHAWTEVITIAATCTEPGEKTKTCSTCSATETEAIEALGHSYAEGVCSVCGEAQPAAKSYELISNASKLAEGDKIIIVGAKGEVYYAMSTEQKTNNRGQIEVAVAEDGSITEIEGVQVITLGGGEGAWTLGVTDGVLTATSTTTSNYLRTAAEADQYCYFSIEIDGTTGVATVKAINKTSRNWMRYNSTSSCFACYTSGQNDIYIYREIDENACAHEWGEWNVDAAASCETAGSQSRTCALCSEVETMEIPATGHTYNYVDNTTTVDGTCACGATVSYTVNTIAEAKADTEGTATYNVKGIVTYVSETEYYIQDETGALCIYFGYNATMPEVALGDMLFVRDTITTYKGLIETTNTTAAEVVVLSAENELPLAEVTLADLLADTTNEYLGERVIIKDLTIGVINPADVTALTDAEGNTINIYKAEGLAENVSANDTVDVIAIVSTRDGYQLRVNPGTAATDVVVTAEGEEEVVTVSTIADAIAGEAGAYYLVEGVVTFIDGRNVTIQDETAGLNVYLKASAANTVVGDKVRVYGTISTYNGLIQFSGIDETNADFYSVISADNTVEAQAVALADLIADTTNEYLSEKVALTNLTITAVGSYSTSSKTVTYTVSDGTNTISIYKAPAATAEDVLTVGSIINVEAIVSTYNGYQLRVVDASKIEVIGTCEHATTELQNVVAGDCVTDGYTGDTVCTLCGAVVTAGETITAPGHNYVDGTCEECGEEEPAPVDYSGTYYIAAVRTAEGSTYAYMSNNLGTASTKRYQAVDSTLTEAPAEIADAIEDYVFTISAYGDGTYYITDAYSAYLTWTSGNSGELTGASPMFVSIEAGEKEGTVRISFTGDALRYLSLNSNASNNYFAWYKSGQVMDLVLIPVAGEIHYHSWNETDRVESTCTDAGSVTYACSCGKTKTETIEANGHANVLVNNGDGTHYTQCCVCLEVFGENVEHTFVDGACECGATEVVEPEMKPDANLAFSMSITVGAEMQVVYTVVASKVSSYESFYLEVSKNVVGGDPVVTTYGLAEGMTEMLVLTNAAGKVSGYRATYTGINAKEMGDEFTATLYAVAADGTIYYSNANTNSIKSFLMGKITDTVSPATLKTLAVDMLNYGAAAQLNFSYDAENLVNADLTDEQKALGTQTIPEAVDSTVITGDGINLTASVTVKSKVELTLTCMYKTEDASNVKFIFKDKDGNVLAELAPTNHVANRAVQCVYDQVGAKQMRELITIEVYDGDTLVSKTLTWSVESYVASTLAKTTTSEILANMVNAMLIYGDSAAAYLG